MNMNYENETIDKAIQAGRDYLNSTNCADTGYSEYWYSTHINVWNKDGKSRIYINMSYGRYYKRQNKWKRGVSRAIDLDTLKTWDCSRDYNNSAERGVVSMISEKIIEVLKNSEVAK